MSHLNFSILVFYASFSVSKGLQNVAFEIWQFPPIFVLLKLTCLVTLFDRQPQVFQNSPKLTIFGILMSTQNVNVACFARNVECDFLYDF